MTISFIIILCTLLLVAYLFDITSSKTKVPSVIMLLLLGWCVGLSVANFDIRMPDLNPILPVLGTLGLILIVLEGSLELEINKSKLALIGKTTLMALLPIVVLSLVLGAAISWMGKESFKIALANAIPLAIISSAVAIPSTYNLPVKVREFVTYESSLSDILGVLFFNFITLNDNLGIQSIGGFFLGLLFILLVTFGATILLALLLSKIKHHVKYIPIILMVFLIYAIAKLYHLPGLLFILLFGIFLGNLDELKSFKFIRRLNPDILNREVYKLKELTIEFTFLIRTLFFLLFGFLIKTSELLNAETSLWAFAITASIFLIRYGLLKLLRLPAKPLLFIAPRGLITILLFLSIPLAQQTEVVSKSLIVQVIILTALVMTIGIMTNKKHKEVIQES
jgi:potassium/hydrogen antiporter